MAEFEVYTDALTKQLGAVITQGNRPIACFSRKLTETQQHYSVTEIELLAILEILKEFKGMLWGITLKIFAHHKNLIKDAFDVHNFRTKFLKEQSPLIDTV